MLENSERSVCRVRMGKSGSLEHTELANQTQGFRIPDRWDASEKINQHTGNQLYNTSLIKQPCFKGSRECWTLYIMLQQHFKESKEATNWYDMIDKINGCEHVIDLLQFHSKPYFYDLQNTLFRQIMHALHAYVHIVNCITRWATCRCHSNTLYLEIWWHECVVHH